MSELELPGTPETPEADFVERVIGVPPGCYAVTDGEKLPKWANFAVCLAVAAAYAAMLWEKLG